MTWYISIHNTPERIKGVVQVANLNLQSIFVPPLQGLIISYNRFPTAYAVGYYCVAPNGAW